MFELMKCDGENSERETEEEKLSRNDEQKSSCVRTHFFTLN